MTVHLQRIDRVKWQLIGAFYVGKDEDVSLNVDAPHNRVYDRIRVFFVEFHGGLWNKAMSASAGNLDPFAESRVSFVI